MVTLLTCKQGLLPPFLTCNIVAYNGCLIVIDAVISHRFGNEYGTPFMFNGFKEPADGDNLEDVDSN